MGLVTRHSLRKNNAVWVHDACRTFVVSCFFFFFLLRWYNEGNIFANQSQVAVREEKREEVYTGRRRDYLVEMNFIGLIFNISRRGKYRGCVAVWEMKNIPFWPKISTVLYFQMVLFYCFVVRKTCNWPIKQ